ncbi:MAG: hypothetical protein ACRDBH_08860 [Bosea sp. (in: a-proteobacteria)]
MRLPALAFFITLPLASTSASAQQISIFDAHIHYSHDAVELVPPKAAAELLRRAGLKKALVSSSDDEGTQRLLAEAPDIVVPSLRPYRRRSDTATWTNDPGIIAYVEDRLKRFKYSAIGEFHAYNADIDKPVVQRIIALAKQHNLLLHAHSDADAIDRIFKTDPSAKVLWAHSGFDKPERVREMLRKHKNLWSDLAFRNEHAQGDSVAPDWRAAFEEFPERFMVGTDTFAPERWHYIADHAGTSRRWLASLPKGIAEGIAFRNAEVMLSRVAPTAGTKR